MSKVVLGAILVAITGLVSAPTPTWAQKRGADHVRILAIVGDELITNVDVEKARHEWQQGTTLRGGSQEAGPDTPTLVDALIDQKLLDREILAKKIAATDSEVADEASRALLERGTSKQEFETELIRQGSSFPQFIANLEQNIKRSKLAEQYIYSSITLSEADLRNYYNQYPAKFRGYHKLQFRQIVLLPDDLTSPESAQKTAEDAVRLAQKIKKGATFEVAAKQWDHGPWANNGGLSPELDSNTLDPELARILCELEPNKVAGPILTQKGIFILKLVLKEEPFQEPYEKVRSIIERLAYQQKSLEAYNNYITLLRRKNYIDIRL